MKLFFAAPLSGLPSLLTALGSQTSFLHFFTTLVLAGPLSGLPSTANAEIKMAIAMRRLGDGPGDLREQGCEQGIAIALVSALPLSALGTRPPWYHGALPRGSLSDLPTRLGAASNDS